MSKIKIKVGDTVVGEVESLTITENYNKYIDPRIVDTSGTMNRIKFDKIKIRKHFDPEFNIQTSPFQIDGPYNISNVWFTNYTVNNYSDSVISIDNANFVFESISKLLPDEEIQPKPQDQSALKEEDMSMFIKMVSELAKNGKNVNDK